MTAFKAACVQLNSGNDLAANLKTAAAAVREAAAAGAKLITLPEYAVLLDGSGRVMRDNSFAEESHPALAELRALARETATWLLVGSLTVKIDDSLMANRSYLLGPDGTTVASYDKIHMFDVTLPSGKVIRESRAYRPGNRAVVAATPWGALGMTICYDLRFPQLFRALAKAGALFLAVPSSFQRETGVAHWHALLRARAIEKCRAWTTERLHDPLAAGIRHILLVELGAVIEQAPAEFLEAGDVEGDVVPAAFLLVATRPVVGKAHHDMDQRMGILIQPQTLVREIRTVADTETEHRRVKFFDGRQIFRAAADIDMMNPVQRHCVLPFMRIEATLCQRRGLRGKHAGNRTAVSAKLRDIICRRACVEFFPGRALRGGRQSVVSRASFSVLNNAHSAE